MRLLLVKPLTAAGSQNEAFNQLFSVGHIFTFRRESNDEDERIIGFLITNRFEREEFIDSIGNSNMFPVFKDELKNCFKELP